MRVATLTLVLAMTLSARTNGNNALPSSASLNGKVQGQSPSRACRGDALATGTITLSDALALALANHPDLRSFPYELRAAEARVMQAGLRPNPELEVEVEEFGGSGGRSGFDGAETTLRIGQPIELGGKRARRTDLASLEKELVRWDYESARRDAVREVAQAFAAVLAAQERVVLAGQSLELAREAQSAVSRRIEAGRDSPVDELRAGAVVSESRIELHKAQRALTVARHNLAALWGDHVPAFETVEGDLYEVEPPVEPDDPAAVIDENPDVGRWETEQEQRRAALRLEKARAAPDVTISGGVQRFEEAGESALVFGLSLPIPLFDRNQGGIAEATARLAQARRRYEAVRVRTLAALSEAVGTLGAAYEEAAILREDVLSRARQAFDAARQGYQQGKFDYLYVLDAQRSLFETRARYIDSVEAYHKSRADVERLTGRPGSTVQEKSSRENDHEK